MSKRALIVYGGWDGHQPDLVAELFEQMLRESGVETVRENTLDAFVGHDLMGFDLIVPIWTMGEITPEQRKPVTDAVCSGVGLAGCHGGMCDAFRADTEWQFMTGGQWVAHPGDDQVRYTVHVHPGHAITEGLGDFEVVSEQYYLHTDPGNRVLATCRFPTPGVGGPHEDNPCDMPTVWVKSYGRGRVFYNALGHRAADLEAATPRELMRRGFLWAMR